jgi:hypothetical protein
MEYIQAYQGLYIIPEPVAIDNMLSSIVAVISGVGAF